MITSATTHLRVDPVMAQLIDTFGEVQFDYEVNLYEDLISSIISQQLSVKAADTIFKRFKALFDNKVPTPDQILAIEDQKIRDCGISFSKISYIKGICAAIKQDQLHLDKFDKMSDEEVMEELIKLKGVGKWTAEMFLMFSLKRPDVFSLGDMGLRNAVTTLYGIDKNNIQKIEELSLTWKPYRTYAARYLWKSLDNTPK